MTRQTGRTLAVLALVLGLAAMGLAQPKTLTILHTNDSHSALLPLSHQPYPTPFTWLWPDHRMGWLDEFRGPGGFDRDYAGIARMSTLIKKLKRGKIERPGPSRRGRVRRQLRIQHLPGLSRAEDHGGPLRRDVARQP